VKRLRLRAGWLIVIPFLLWSTPSAVVVFVGVVFVACGLVVRGWSAGTIRKDEELATSGPYSFTRNPLYVGSFLIGMGVAIAGGQWIWPLAFLSFYGAVYPSAMLAEAQRLSQLFPHHYAVYARAVPGFIPRLTPYRSSEVAAGPAGFRWSQFRRNREWEASLGALAVFGLLAAKVVWL